MSISTFTPGDMVRTTGATNISGKFMYLRDNIVTMSIGSDANGFTKLESFLEDWVEATGAHEELTPFERIVINPLPDEAYNKIVSECGKQLEERPEDVNGASAVKLFFAVPSGLQNTEMLDLVVMLNRIISAYNGIGGVELSMVKDATPEELVEMQVKEAAFCYALSRMGVSVDEILSDLSNSLERLESADKEDPVQ